MAFNFLNKSKRGADTTGEPAPDAFKRDPRKAAKFFDHAQAVADAQNWDYAIDCLIQGLRHDPDNLNRHEMLRDVATRRRVAGGKPTPMSERFKSLGRDAVAKFLDAEKLWAKDPLNVDALLTAMERCIESDAQESGLNLLEVAYWLGERAMEINAGAKKSKKVWVKLRELFASFEAFDKAVECARHAVQMDPENDELLKAFRDMEAENSMKQGGYGRDRATAREEAKAAAPESEQGTEGDESDTLGELLAQRRAEHEERPEDLGRFLALIDLMVRAETDELDREAAERLQAMSEKTGDFALSIRAGDLQIRRFHRVERRLRAQLKLHPDDEETRKQRDEIYRRRMAFELKEFGRRADAVLNDRKSRFEYARRLLMFKKYEEAIAAFQQVQDDPLLREQAMQGLGEAYFAQGLLDEARDTLSIALEKHSATDSTGLGIRYALMEVLEQLARRDRNVEQAELARQLASKILQTKIDYRDIKERLEKLKLLVAALKA